ncbi:MAG: DUF2142 domain-containing protein [Lachnospiraceae bacterium]|nr:DUF2142 domain-containing protein [Lachnospiraceae bacterium]
MNKRVCKSSKAVKIVCTILFSIVIALLLEVLVYNGKKQDETIALQVYDLSQESQYVMVEQNEILEPLTRDEQNSIQMNRENAKILAEVNGTPYVEETDDTLVEQDGKLFRRKIDTSFTVTLPERSYIRKLHLSYGGMEENGSFTIQMKDGDQTTFDGYDGIMDAKLAASVVTVNKSGDQIIYHFKSLEKPELSHMKLSVVNLTSINWLRILFFAAAGMLLGFFIWNRSLFHDRLEIVFVIASLTLGGILILSVGTNQIGFDEYTHAARAYEVSFGSTIETTETAMRMRANDLPFFHNREERGLVEAYENVNNDFSWADISTQSRFVSYTDRSYLPISVMIKLGRALHMPFAWNMMLGKLGNLLCYTFLCYLAVKYAKSGKGIIALLALLPNALFAAGGFTYDGVVNGFLLLAVVLTTNLMLEEDQKITWIQVLLVLGAYIAGSTAKPVYIVMALMLVFFSRKRFQNPVQAWGFRAAVVVIIGLLMYTIFFPPVSTSANYELVGNLAYAGDKRNQGTSVLGQLEYILQYPLVYTGLLLSSMFGDLFQYVSGKLPFFNYGYLGNLSGVYTVIGEVLLVLGCVFSPNTDKRNVIGKQYKVLNIIMILGLSAIIWTSMYVSYTPVGASEIQGVQARYFMPLFLPFCYCLCNNKWKCKISVVNYHKILVGFAVALNLYAIYHLALQPLNF